MRSSRDLFLGVYDLNGDSRAVQEDIDILRSQNRESLLNTYRAKLRATLKAPLKSLKTNFKMIKLPVS